MSDIPQILARHLASHATQKFQPAWLKLEKNGTHILEVGGAWKHYFHACPELGRDASEICDVLLGMLPLLDNFELPQMQLMDEKYTNLFAVCGENADWLLFCDVTEETRILQRHQQVSNELVLLQGQLNRTLTRYVGSEVAKRDDAGDLTVSGKGERRMISTLFTDIRGFTPFNERHDAQVVIETLNAYMDCMLPPILNEAGMIDKITGDGAMALFGVLPSQQHHIQHAFLAAQQILNHVDRLNKKRQRNGLEALGVGVGIATGEAVLGMLGTHDRRCFTAIGTHVNRAARLESHAHAGEILLDNDSYVALMKPVDCSLVRLDLKGIGETTAYSWKY